MDPLNIVEVTRVSSKVVEEVSNAVKEFESFNSREADLLSWDVP